MERNEKARTIIISVLIPWAWTLLTHSVFRGVIITLVSTRSFSPCGGFLLSSNQQPATNNQQPTTRGIINYETLTIFLRII